MRIVIAGLARTGTTGLFAQLRNSIEGDVRTLFEVNGYVPEELDTQRTVLAKILIGRDNHADYTIFDDFDRKICLVRDPRDRIVSSLLFRCCRTEFLEDEKKLQKLLDLIRLKEQDPTQVSVEDIARLQAQLEGQPKRNPSELMLGLADPQQWQLDFLAKRPDQFVLRYEDFVVGKLGDLADYLGFAIGGSAEVNKRFKRVVRTKSSGDWRNWLLESDVALLRQSPVLDRFMSEFQYSASWLLPENPSVKAEFASQYVKMLAAEKRKWKKVSVFVSPVLKAANAVRTAIDRLITSR